MQKTTVLASKKLKKQAHKLLSGIMYDFIETASGNQLQQIVTKDGEKKVRQNAFKVWNVDITDEWADEKISLEKFWKTVFQYTINWEDFELPIKTTEFPHLNIRPAGFTAEQMYSSIVNSKKDDGKTSRFTKRSKYYSNIDDAIKNAKAVQPRPNGNYAWADRGSDEPDTCHLGKSYDDAITAKITFEGPVEYMLSGAEFEFRTGKVYDIKGITYLSVLDSDGRAMGGYRNYDGDVYLGSSSRTHQYPGYGPREAVLAL